MFSFRRPRDPGPMLQLYRINIHVARGTNTEMPAECAGAYVPVFVVLRITRPPRALPCPTYLAKASSSSTLPMGKFTLSIQPLGIHLFKRLGLISSITFPTKPPFCAGWIANSYARDRLPATSPPAGVTSTERLLTSAANGAFGHIAVCDAVPPPSKCVGITRKRLAPTERTPDKPLPAQREEPSKCAPGGKNNANTAITSRPAYVRHSFAGAQADALSARRTAGSVVCFGYLRAFQHAVACDGRRRRGDSRGSHGRRRLLLGSAHRLVDGLGRGCGQRLQPLAVTL